MKRHRAHNQSCIVVGRLRTFDYSRIIAALNRTGNGDAAQAKQRRHNIRRINRHIDSPAGLAMHRRIAEKKRDSDRLVPRLLLFSLAVRMQHVTMIGGKDENCILFNPAFIQCVENIPNTVIQSGNMRVITGQLLPGLLPQ